MAARRVAHRFESIEDVQAVTALMISEVDSIARAHGLSVFLAYGTALGSVRHAGFIPWDFDGDMHVMREDSDRLVCLLEDELSDQFAVWRPGDAGYRQMFPRVGVKGVSDELIRLDLFPLDHASVSPAVARVQGRLSHLLMQAHLVRTMAGPKPTHYGRRKRLLAILARSALILVPPALLRLAHTTVQRFLGNPRSERRLNAFGSYGRSEIFDAHWFEPVGAWFEGEQVTSFAGVDEYLAQLYGAYMTPPSSAVVTRQLAFVDEHYVKPLKALRA